jgi:hypothetical protein
MPTQRARLTVTETPELEEQLNRAAARFPELAARRRELLLRLAEIGDRTLAEGDDDSREAAKQRVLARTRAITPEQAEAMLAARERDWQHELEY